MTEKIFDRADLLRYFHETDSDAVAGHLVVIHPPTPQQLAFDRDAEKGETTRYPVLAETTALFCERYGFSVIVQQVVWSDGGSQYLGADHPLRVLTRHRRAITRYGGTSSQLSRWAAELADAYRQEVAACIPAAPIDRTGRRTNRDTDPDQVYQQPDPEPEPPADDSDHNATGDTMDDFLNQLGSDSDPLE